MASQFALSETTVLAFPRQSQVLDDLCAMREEWEAAAEGGSLLEITAPVGLLLFDVATKLRLTLEERSIFLGERLSEEVTTLTG